MNALALLAVQESGTAGAASALPYVVIGIWILFLSVFVGFELIAKVPPTLHTPLMSGANAISGITLVGALYCAGQEYSTFAHVLGFLAVAMATTNAVGGFMVTDRMLSMFGSKKKPGGRA